MKKLFILLLSIGITISSYSTHLMGGQIVATYLSTDSTGSHYTIELTAYRDTVGIPMAVSAIFNVRQLDTSGNWNLLFNHTINYDTTSGGLMPTFSVYGIEVYTYFDTITLPGNGQYSITYEECCRNGAIVNMSNPLNESMRLITQITNDSANPSSSPSYLTPPVAYLPADTLWSYNPLPFDPDGDSLSWSLVTPLGATSTVNGYQYLSDSMYSNPTGIFTLDSVTGGLTWDASLVGNFVASFLIEEYRAGVKIGEMRRDMQFVVIYDTSNSMPNISNMQSVPTNSGGYPYVKINPGQNYQLHLIANDADVNDVLDMEAYGESFNLTLSPSSHSVALTGNGNEIEGIFSWNPDITHVRTTPYLVVFRTTDNFFYYDETIQFEVTSEATSLTGVQRKGVSNIYPNPANDRLFIPVFLNQSESLTLDIYNMVGVRISSNKLDLGVGNNIIMKNIDLKSGQYIISIKDEIGRRISTQELMIVK